LKSAQAKKHKTLPKKKKKEKGARSMTYGKSLPNKHKALNTKHIEPKSNNKIQ
jgi:hypothetical protein